MGVKILKRFTLFLRDDFRCLYCDTLGLVPQGTPRDEDLTIDHFHAKSKGGSNRLRNLFTSCQNCNRAKGPKTFALQHHPNIHLEYKKRKKRNPNWERYRKCMMKIFDLFRDDTDSREQQREQVAIFLNQQILDWCLTLGEVSVREYLVATAMRIGKQKA